MLLSFPFSNSSNVSKVKEAEIYKVILQRLYDIRITRVNIKKTHFKNKHYSPHGAFICPPKIVNKLFNKRNKFNESHKIDADGIWMNNIRKECSSNMIKIFMNISIHQLGGVSTDPTIKSVLMYFNIGFNKGIKELIKLVIQKLSLTRIWYYKILYFYKYIEINKNYKD